MTKVAVIRNAGGGKSTNEKPLARLMVCRILQLTKFSGSQAGFLTPEQEYAEKHSALVANDRWLIDGFGTWKSIEERFSAADTIIFVDHPIWIHFWWATKRQIKSIFAWIPRIAWTRKQHAGSGLRKS
ncbi:MAG: hypothetical protein R3F54_28175 [Alphaproteobacteria bacterium]